MKRERHSCFPSLEDIYDTTFDQGALEQHAPSASSQHVGMPTTAARSCALLSMGARQVRFALDTRSA